jgi:NAD-dependent SIR2 family protein deacetylase
MWTCGCLKIAKFGFFYSFFEGMESSSPFEERVRSVAQAILSSKKTVLFIGAGASASAGVPTFRGTNAAESLLEVREDHLVFPNFTHLACRKLLASKVVAGAVSSNHDGLLGQQGPNVVEIFGSVLTETCLSCGGRFRRKFAPPPLNRKCECGGKLKKTGCRYGQAIFKPGLEAATSLAEDACVALVLGSGMHTWPLSVDGFPSKAKRVVLVTLGETAADRDESIERFDCTCDSFMEVLMKELNLAPVDPFVFEEEFQCRWKTVNGMIELVVVRELKTLFGFVVLTKVFKESGDAPAESLCFAHEGEANGIELLRSNLTYSLSGTVPSKNNIVEVLLQPRAEFGECEKVRVVVELVAESGQQKQKFSKIIK